MFAKGQGGTFTAIDFDARRVRVVQMDVGSKKLRVRKMKSVDLPADLSVTDAQAFGAFLGEVLKEMRLGSGGVLMHVPRGQAVLKPLSLPNVEANDDLPGMVRYQVEKELPFAAEQAVIDFAVENHFDAEKTSTTNSDSLELLVAAVHQKVVDHYQQIAEAAGIKIRRLGLRPYANMRCIDVCRVIEPGHSVAVIHITAEETEIDVFGEQSVNFSRAAVVKLAELRGQGDKGTSGGASGGDTEAVEQVVSEVTRSLKSYQAVQRGQSIRKILVAGDTGIESQVINRLKDEFDVMCGLFAPASGLDLGKSQEEASAYISAFGLAIGQGQRGTAIPFDFINPKKPTHRVDPRKRKWMMIGAAAALVLLIGTFFIGSHIAEARRELNAMIDEHNKLREELSIGSTLVSRVNDIDKWVGSSRDWLSHWTQISALFPPAHEAYITTMRAGSDTNLNITFRARSSDVINGFGERLAEAGYEFRPGQVNPVTDPYGYVQETSMRIIVDPRMKIDLEAIPPIERPDDGVEAQLPAATPPLTVQASAPTAAPTNTPRFNRPAPTANPTPTTPQRRGGGGNRGGGRS